MAQQVPNIEGIGKQNRFPTSSQNFVNFGHQTDYNRTGVFTHPRYSLPFSVYRTPLLAALTWRITANLIEMALGLSAASIEPPIQSPKKNLTWQWRHVRRPYGYVAMHR